MFACFTDNKMAGGLVRDEFSPVFTRAVPFFWHSKMPCHSVVISEWVHSQWDVLGWGKILSQKLFQT